MKRGPNRDIDSVEAMKLQMAHMNNIDKMAAEALTNTDPAIKVGSLVMELKVWYGSAALMGLNDAHNKIQKKELPNEGNREIGLGLLYSFGWKKVMFKKINFYLIFILVTSISY